MATLIDSLSIALSRNWWLLLLRGAVAIAFALLTWMQPGITLVALVLLFGIYAVADGIVSVAKYSETWGGQIVIDHTVGGQAVSTGYIHMWRTGIHVNVGDRVTAGLHGLPWEGLKLAHGGPAIPTRWV